MAFGDEGPGIAHSRSREPANLPGIERAGLSCLMFWKRNGVFRVAAAAVLLAAGIWPAQAGASAGLTAAQIVDQMERRGQERTAALKHYEALRHYTVEYRGFAATVVGRMDVEASYDAAAGKSLRIVAQSGSKFLCEKVLKRAVESEKEASRDQGASAFSAANYRFRLEGSDSVDGRPAYLLEVEPLTQSKFLIRGKIWVDAADFAVVRMEAEPAKNPSFWISKTLIRSVRAKTGDFWLPRETRSETRVRIGGTAVMTIDYGTYKIGPGAER